MENGKILLDLALFNAQLITGAVVSWNFILFGVSFFSECFLIQKKETNRRSILLFLCSIQKKQTEEASCFFCAAYRRNKQKKHPAFSVQHTELDPECLLIKKKSSTNYRNKSDHDEKPHSLVQ